MVISGIPEEQPIRRKLLYNRDVKHEAQGPKSSQETFQFSTSLENITEDIDLVF